MDFSQFKNFCSVVDLANGRRDAPGREPVSASLADGGLRAGQAKHWNSACSRVQLESERGRARLSAGRTCGRQASPGNRPPLWHFEGSRWNRCEVSLLTRQTGPMENTVLPGSGELSGASAWDTCPRVVLGFSGAGGRAARSSSVRCPPGAAAGGWPSDSRGCGGRVADPVRSSSEAGHGAPARAGDLVVAALAPCVPFAGSWVCAEGAPSPLCCPCPLASEPRVSSAAFSAPLWFPTWPCSGQQQWLLRPCSVTLASSPCLRRCPGCFHGLPRETVPTRE